MKRLLVAVGSCFGAFVAFAADGPIRAVQLDLARQTETVPVIEAFTRKVAAAGYNTLVLYLEGRVATKSFAMANAANVLADDWRPVRFGFPDRAVAFDRPAVAEMENVVECSLKEDEWHVR